MFSQFSRPWYQEQYANLRENYEWRARTIPNVPGFTDEEAELRDLYDADVNACWNEYRDKFITGALDLDADWEEYLKTIDAFGLPEMTQVYQSVYDRTR
jgi:putative aldouronate transport system substrate-binding protein